MTAPVLARAKLLLAAGISMRCLCSAASSRASPRRPNLHAGCCWVPWVASRSARCSYFSALFALPVPFGLIGGILGLLVLGQGWGYAFPYSLLSLSMRANNPERTLAPAPFLRGIHRAVCGAFHPVYAAAGGDRRITLPFGKSPSAGKPANGLFLIIAR